MKLPRTAWSSSPATRIGALVVALAVVTGIAVVSVTKLTGLPPDAAFSFGGTDVSKAELTDRVHLLGALYGIAEPEDVKAQDTFRRDVAQAVAVSMILDRAAKDEGIEISSKSARDTLSEMISSQLGADPQTAFTSILGQYGVNEDDVLGEIKRQQSIARLFRLVTKEAVATATPTAAAAYFAEDPARFAIPEQRQISNIVVRTRAEAKAVLLRARSTDFATLATSTTLDDATRAQAGDLGTVTAAQLDPAFAEVAFSAAEGGLFGPVKSEFGWNVGKVGTVVAGRSSTFASVEERVTDDLRSGRGLAAWRDWLRDQIRHADVDYAAVYRPAHPDELPADTSVVNPPTAPLGVTP
jgi:peptidyl-prolyl cis-trans isomerase C